MGWGPTKEVIEKEVNNYKGLGFFGKAKNLLVSFIIVKSVIHCSYLLYKGTLVIDGSTIPTSLFLGIFIYLNHRWAIAAFFIWYLGERVLLNVVGFDHTPVLSLIFVVLVTILSYQSYRVATQLKKNANVKMLNG